MGRIIRALFAIVNRDRIINFYFLMPISKKCANTRGKTMNRTVLAAALIVASWEVFAADVDFSGVSYKLSRSGSTVEVVGRLVNNSSRPANIEITYGCDDKDGNPVDMYSFVMSVGGGETVPFKRGQVRYSKSIDKCWVSARDF